MTIQKNIYSKSYSKIFYILFDSNIIKNLYIILFKQIFISFQYKYKKLIFPKILLI